MVDCLTKDKYKGNLLVILAGYEDDIDKLLSVNRGLASRFPEELVFVNMTPNECLSLLNKVLNGHNIQLDNSCDADIVDIFRDLSGLKSWGNARDVQTLAKKMTSIALQRVNPTFPTAALQLTGSEALQVMQDMLVGMQARARGSKPPQPWYQNFPPAPPSAPLAGAPPPFGTGTSAGTAASSAPKGKAKAPSVKAASSGSSSDSDSGSSTQGPTKPAKSPRDPGVSDSVWDELQRSKQAALAAERELERLKAQEELTQRLEAQAREEIRKAALLDAQAKQRAEALRLKAEAERAKRAQEAARRKKLEEEKQKEMVIQQKIQQMGVCVQGFQWIKIPGGYRCAGGMHYLSDGQLGI